MIPILRFDPRESGTRCWLGPLELRIMVQVWDVAAPITVRRVWRALDREQECAYTTILSTMTRLTAKGLLTRQRRGMAYVFAATCTEDEFLELQTRHVLAALEGVPA